MDVSSPRSGRSVGSASTGLNSASPRHQRHWTHTFSDGSREQRLHSHGEPPPSAAKKRRPHARREEGDDEQQDEQADDGEEAQSGADRAEADEDPSGGGDSGASAAAAAAAASASAAVDAVRSPSPPVQTQKSEDKVSAHVADADSDGMEDDAAAHEELAPQHEESAEAADGGAAAEDDRDDASAADEDAAAVPDETHADETHAEHAATAPETADATGPAPAAGDADGAAAAVDSDDSSASSDTHEPLVQKDEEQDEGAEDASDDGAAAMDVDDFRDDESDAEGADENGDDDAPFARRAGRGGQAADADEDDGADHDEGLEDAEEFGEGVAEDEYFEAEEEDAEEYEQEDEEEEGEAAPVPRKAPPPRQQQRAVSSGSDDDSDVVDLTLSDDDEPPPLVAKKPAAAARASSTSGSGSSDSEASSASSASSAASSPHVAPAIPAASPTSLSDSPIPDAQFSPEPDADADAELSPEPLPDAAAVAAASGHAVGDSAADNAASAAAAPAIDTLASLSTAAAPAAAPAAAAEAPSKPLFTSPFASSPHRPYTSRAQTNGTANSNANSSSKASFMSPPHRPQKSPSASMDAQALPSHSAAFASFAAAPAAATAAAAGAAAPSNGPAMSTRGRTGIKQWPQPKFYRELMNPRLHRPPPAASPPAVTRITYQWETLVPQMDPHPRHVGDTRRLPGSLISHPHSPSFQHASAAAARRHNASRSTFYALERERLTRRSEQLARQEQAIRNYAKKKMEPIEDDLSSILESLSMNDVAAPVDQSNYRSQPLAVRDRFIGATVARRMFVAKAAPPWMVNALLEELMTEVVREVVLETVADSKKTSPLSDAELKKSSELLLSPPNKVIADKFNIEITGKELSCLRNLNWLNDETINFYLEMLRERSKRNQSSACVLSSQRDRIHFYSSFFYTKLTQGGAYLHKNVARWSKMAKIDVSELDKIILPVHVGHNHWCCAIINIREKQLEYYDSLGGTNPTCLQYLRRYVEDEVRAHRPERLAALAIDSWREINVKAIPQQNNGSDCGVFTLKFADYASENRPFTFTYKDMPYFRRRIALEIANQKVL